MDILASMPAKFRAGDTIEFKKSIPGFAANDGWVLHYYILAKSGSYHVQAIIDSDNPELFRVKISSSISKEYKAGKYRYTAFIKKSDDRYSVEEGFVEILQNFEVSEVVDTRHPFEIALEALEARIAGSATPEQLNRDIDGIKIGYLTPDQLESKWLFLNRMVQKVKGKGGIRTQKMYPGRG